MQTRMLIFPNLLGAVLSVVLVWLLIRIMGASGIGPALTLSALGALALSFLTTKRFTIIPINYRKLIQLFAMGVGMWLCARFSYYFASSSSDLFGTLLSVVLTGMLFCGFQLVFLHRTIWPDKETRRNQS
jgi:O-antigen/teichoic acid export membrane protein